MIIQDLEHQEVVCETNNVEGALATLNFNLEFLSIGTLISISDITRAEFLTTENPGVNVSSGKFSISMQAIGPMGLELGI